MRPTSRQSCTVGGEGQSQWRGKAAGGQNRLTPCRGCSSCTEQAHRSLWARSRTCGTVRRLVRSRSASRSNEGKSNAQVCVVVDEVHLAN